MYTLLLAPVSLKTTLVCTSGSKQPSSSTCIHSWASVQMPVQLFTSTCMCVRVKQGACVCVPIVPVLLVRLPGRAYTREEACVLRFLTLCLH